jgi:iron(III) transport system substrate-binding protein
MTIHRRAVLSWPLAGVLGAAGVASAQQHSERSRDDLVKAANAEGNLLIYSIMAAENWKPILARFSALYPKIAVQTLDLPSQSEPFERYLAETATKSRTADLIFSPGNENWIDLHKRGEIMPLALPQAEGMESWMMPVPGLYGLSVTPVAIVWNNVLVPEKERPKDFAQFVELVKSKGSLWRGKIASYTPMATFGRTVHGTYARFAGEKAWDQYAVLAASAPRFERSGGAMVEKILSGEYAAGWFVATSTLWPRLKDPTRAKLLGWSFIGPGQPVLLSAAAVPRASRNQNAARLMLEFLLSVEGQRLLGSGGLTPIRPGLKPEGGALHTYSSIAEAVGGADQMARVDIDPAKPWDHEGFVDRYKKVFSLS